MKEAKKEAEALCNAFRAEKEAAYQASMQKVMEFNATSDARACEHFMYRDRSRAIVASVEFWRRVSVFLSARLRPCSRPFTRGYHFLDPLFSLSRTRALKNLMFISRVFLRSL